MKGTSLIVSIVLAIAVIILYVLQFTGSGNKNTGGNGDLKNGSNGSLKIAYIKADSVIVNYNLSQDLHDDFTKKQETYTNEYAQKRQSFEREAASFQEKVQRGGFLTEQRALQERDRLVGKEKEIVQLDQQLSAKLAEMQNVNNQQILDSIMGYLKVYNAGNKYDYILNGASVLVGKDADNITANVLTALNSRYTSKVKTK